MDTWTISIHPLFLSSEGDLRITDISESMGQPSRCGDQRNKLDLGHYKLRHCSADETVHKIVERRGGYEETVALVATYVDDFLVVGEDALARFFLSKIPALWSRGKVEVSEAGTLATTVHFPGTGMRWAADKALASSQEQHTKDLVTR